ncbi:LIC_10190 family membrane protein [Gelatiniphilus marinus]|uniref:LIC_10190 family membrane protein n=1 Tax=Gelatiniphilus marinus TaxID=1759464 RepID=A0ABW5JT57_9FLAO
MLLIFLSWIYIFFTAKNFGILFTKIFNIKTCNCFVVIALGLLFYTITTSFFAFFIRINIEYYLLVLCLNLLLAYRFKNIIIDYLSSTFKTFKSLNIQHKILYLFLFTILLAQSSTKPYLIDNETYYIQTIKWINEFGYVKGLANVHMFLGQNSSWHTLQAGFNFPFFSNFHNDINGFLFVVFSIFAVEKLSNNSENIQDFSLGLILLFSLFLMQFVNAPSPDLIIFLITPYIFYLFIVNYKNISKNDFKIFLSLVLFLCFVKVTMVVLSTLILILFLNNYNTLKSQLWQYLFFSITVLVLFISKNAIVSGYLLYPITQIDLVDFDWKVPKELLNFYKLGTYLEGMSNMDVSQLGFLEKVKVWLTLPKLDGLFNKAFILLLIVFPWAVYKNKDKSSLFIIFILAIIQLVLLWFTSPQYRFFFVFVSFLGIQVFLRFSAIRKAGLYLVYLSVILSAIPVFITIDLNAFTNNNFAMELNTFKLKNIIIPEANTKTETKYTMHNIDGFEFYSPNEDVFFWATGDGNLPCVNKKQIDYIRYYYNYVPQMRTDNLKDGFKSIAIEKTIKN